MAKAEWGSSTELINQAEEILKAENPMTVRQCFYRLVSCGALENNKRSYNSIKRLLTKARKDGRIDFNWIVDRSRPTYSPCVFDNPQAYAETMKSIYRKDYWQTQPWHVEIWAEKDAICGAIESITNDLGIIVRTGRGYFSTTRKHEVAEFFDRQRHKDKNILVIYLGDHDPSGKDMENDVAGAVRGYMKDIAPDDLGFLIQKLAIHREDIARFNLPPLKVKDGDSRAKGFQKTNGRKCVELDALPVEELRRRIRDRVNSLIDQERWGRAVAVEKVELASILDTMKSWPGMSRAMDSLALNAKQQQYYKQPPLLAAPRRPV